MNASSVRTLVAALASALLAILVLLALGRLDEGLELRRSGGWPGSRPLDFESGDSGVREFVAEARPRNLLLLIGDGMGFGQLALARNELVGPNGRLEMERAPTVGWHTTHAVDSLATDSAASATALASGVKTHPGALGVDAEGRSAPTLAERMRDAGGAVGLITDSYLWDATPGAFAAHVTTRRDYAAVAGQLAGSDFDLLVGRTRSGGEDLLAGFEAEGWRVEEHFERWREGTLEGGPTVGIFEGLPAGEPSLLDVVRVAVTHLESTGEGFLLLVETEETDSGSHRNDLERVVAGVQALDRVAAWAYDYAARDGETLVVVTADHDTGAPVVLGGAPGEPQSIRWTSGHHTAQPVPVFAFGAGAQRLSGVLDDVEIHDRIVEVLDLAP